MPDLVVPLIIVGGILVLWVIGWFFNNDRAHKEPLLLFRLQATKPSFSLSRTLESIFIEYPPGGGKSLQMFIDERVGYFSFPNMRVKFETVIYDLDGSPSDEFAIMEVFIPKSLAFKFHTIAVRWQKFYGFTLEDSPFNQSTTR